MKKILLIIILIIAQSIHSQTNFSETQKLAATCKVWGFLKYYHPKVAHGDFNWDKQLLEMLPKIYQAKTKDEFSLVLENWIDSLGEVPAATPIALTKDVQYFDKNFDLSWIKNKKLFSENLAVKLKFIEQNRFQGDQYYITTFNAGNVLLQNENYSNFQPNSKESRLQVLFMYWNLMEYFFPYKYLMDKNWNTTLEEMVPIFINAENEDDFYTAMKKLTVRLNDSHAIFYKYPIKEDEQKKNINYFPAKCKIIDDKIIVTKILSDSLAKADDIKVGDVITKINDKTIKEIISENKEIVNGSNEAFYLKNLEMPILSGYSDNVKLEFLEDGQYKSKMINWYQVHDAHRNEYRHAEIKEKFKILNNNIGYVDMGLLKIKNVPSMIEKLKLTKAIIFDLRNYPNGTYKEISNFLNSKPKEFVVYTKPDLTYPGRYKWSQPSITGLENNDNYKGKIVVLVNEETLSQAEWTAMCFKTADNTTIIGSQTAGADGNVSDFDLIKAFYTRFTGIGVYYPDKHETQRVGIIPDIAVKTTIKGIQEGKDEILDRALEFIEAQK
ncbi:S41 family peptidase [Flavobacterium sp. AC]|uniref:S41 family peptidase n=1 Tax=Flavobacterium azizsancarii TaxID=2961580 RepID=A0ABT4W9V9_9FLAO|nr:S41 family peptidase [Flavobacterium azizsancarii]MDA6069336.1 S41 family peptidase [Flavobacterium azizsancarii]